jgi:hypothetical protein
MTEGISLPAGAFAAIKSGTPAAAPAAPVKAAPVAAPKVAEPEPPKDLTPAEKKIWRLKADGEEFDFDASDEEAVKREIMKARGADKRFQAGADLRKQAETFFEMLKSPAQLRKVLEDPRIGVDVKKFAEDYVWEQIQEQQMTPEQKLQRDRDRKLAEYEASAEKAATERKRQEQEQRQARYESDYEAKITRALDIGGIPKTHASVARMADYLHKAIGHGHDLSPEELVQEVRKDYLNDFSSVLSAADGDQLLSLIGEANAEKLRKADLKRLKTTQSNPFPQRLRQKESPSAVKGIQKQSGSDWREGAIKDFLSRPR